MGARKLFEKFFGSLRSGKHTDLTKTERPTGRADFFTEDEAFEQELLKRAQVEKTEFELRLLFIALRAKLYARPLSPVPLIFAGCLCTLVLHVTGAPEWAQLGGLVLPWAMGWPRSF